MFIRRVVGGSMLPSLAEGEFVVCVKKRTYNVGDIVIFRIDDKELIKRIHGKTEDKIYVLGDNLAASTDSRQFGPIVVKNIKGRCVTKYRVRPFTVVRL